MAMCAVDEAYRAHIACGGDPEEASALDNFCWPDPVESPETPDGRYKLAQLVRACRGLKDACIAYGLPLISGKDSMKNDARIGGKKVSVKPTLLVSLMGIIRDIGKTVTSDFKSPGDLIYLLGETKNELAGTYYETVTGSIQEDVPKVELQKALPLYRALHAAMEEKLVASCHDISDGGFAVALAESALAGRLGAEVDLQPLLSTAGPDTDTRNGTPRLNPEALLFSESPSRFIVTVKAAKAAEFEAKLRNVALYKLGKVSGSDELLIKLSDKVLIKAELKEIVSRWKREGSSW